MMARAFFTACLFTFCISITGAQDIVNLVMVGDSGITEDIKQAQSFIVIKRYPGSVFERLDYNMGRPLIKLRTYSDSDLTTLHGRYIEYGHDGNMFLEGEYSNNKKQGKWRYYNDTGKVLLARIYDQDSLLGSEDPDTIKKEEVVKFADEREAQFKSGKRDWVEYIKKTLNPDINSRSKNGDRVKVAFVVDTLGRTTGIFLRKSANFLLDEEALRIIRNSPLWQPAFQNGRKVKAYRIQPFTFMPVED